MLVLTVVSCNILGSCEFVLRFGSLFYGATNVQKFIFILLLESCSDQISTDCTRTISSSLDLKNSYQTMETVDSAVTQSITMFLLILDIVILDIVIVKAILDINILDIVIVIVKTILDIDIILISPIADGDDGGGGQRSAAVQHHLLPLLPSHHRLPGTASQQVPALKSFQETIENTLFFSGISNTCLRSTTSCTRFRASSTGHCKLTPPWSRSLRSSEASTYP